MERHDLRAFQSPRTVVVTGGTRGLGRAISLRYADPSAFVIINYVNDDDAAQATAAAVAERGARVRTVKGDISVPAIAENVVAAATDGGGHIDVLIHNAFHRTWQDPLDVDIKEMDRAFHTGPIALALATQVAAPHFPQSGGSIICTSSLATTRIFSARQGVGYFPMAAAKGGLEVTVRYLAARLGRDNIRVNGVSAGWMTTATAQRPELAKASDRIISRTPLGRMATPTEIADVVYALGSYELRWITGQVLVADGGLSLI
jgi:NAD(P)-dependent dehydrogenase (short-subunit alcohol dehydrogenase family)